MADKNSSSLSSLVANGGVETANKTCAFPVLVPLRSGWLASGRGVQVKAGWWEGDLCVFPPNFRGNGFSPAFLSTVESFFWKMGGDCVFNILPEGRACIPQLVDWIESGVRYGHASWDSFLISSPEMSILRYLRLLRPDHGEIRLGLSMLPDSSCSPLELLDSAVDLGVELVQGDLSLLDTSLLAMIRDRRFRIMAENVNGPNQLRRAISLGLDGITTRYPEHVHELIGRLENGRRDDGQC